MIRYVVMGSHVTRKLIGIEDKSLTMEDLMKLVRKEFPKIHRSKVLVNLAVNGIYLEAQIEAKN